MARGRALVSVSLGVLASFGGGCRPAPKASSTGTARPTDGSSPSADTSTPQADGPDETTPDPFAALPRFAVTLDEEMLLPGPPVAAESLFVRKENIEVHTRDGYVVFSTAGTRGASSATKPAMGADGRYDASGLFVYALVIDKSLLWFNFEPTAAVLENMQSATGLAFGVNPALCDGCVYVTDGPAQAVKEYNPTGKFQRALALPGADPEGLAAADSGELYVADARHRRLLRVSSRLESVAAVADLPIGAGGDVPTGLAFDAQGRLYVCFRDRNSIVILKPPAGP
jgi:hypothetical protein